MYFFDTETCGFHGPMVLLQYALDDGPIELHNVWGEPIIDSLLIFDEMCNHPEGVCGFNLAFDWFHVQKTVNCLQELSKVVGENARPIEHIGAYAGIESRARDGCCVKPVTALDLMLHARKGPYQSTMDRKDIRIRRVPKVLAFPLAKELERRIPLSDIYFSRRKDKTASKWRIFPIKQADGREDPDFVDIVLKFAASSALKVLAVDAGVCELETRLLYEDVGLTKPMEVGWAPFATALSTAKDRWYCELGKKKGFAWPTHIMNHYLHWKHDEDAKQYARDDVRDTRGLYEHFNRPEPGDNDSILACMVGSVRWRGYSVDLDAIEKLRIHESRKAASAPKAPAQVHAWISEVMDDTELCDFKDTKKVTLEVISRMKKECSCGKKVTKEAVVNSGVPLISDEALCPVTQTVMVWESECPLCKGTGLITHPAAERAEKVLEARKGFTKQVLYEKLKQAGRLHPAASVIGSLSGRMSGRTEVSGGNRSSNINALGIQHDKSIRRCFPLAFGSLVLNGGDFDAYEVSIADAAYDDEDLRTQLCTCNECGYVSSIEEYGESDDCAGCGGTETRRKIHGLFAMELYPGKSYDDILATKGGDPDLYDNGKRGIFSQFYGGNEDTLVTRIGIEKDDAILASRNFKARYKGVGRAYDQCYDDHCSMRQPNGIGSAVEWHEPKDKVESLNGFPRYFTLENKLTKALFTLANNPPPAWRKINIKVVRRDREQKASGACQSALFAAAFQIQAQCMRAALNHKIQSTGAIETKELQCRLWRLQKPGFQPWTVQPMNIHDEIMCPSTREVALDLELIVARFIEERRSLIPLLKMTWATNMKNWAEKT